MAKFGIRIETTEEGTEQRPQYENLPNGNYRIHMEAGEIVEKNIDAVDHSIMLKSTFEVVEPEEFKGRKIFGNYNLKNKSVEATNIGQKQFQCLLRAIGIEEITEDSETDDLLFHTFVATIGLGKDSKTKNADGTPQYAARPEIKRYWYPDQDDAPELGVTEPAKPANDNRPSANDNKPATKPAASAVKPAGARPWGKKAA